MPCDGLQEGGAAAPARRARRRDKRLPWRESEATTMMLTMLRAVPLALALFVGSSAATSGENATSSATCNPSTWSAGHDFKNMQYSHVPGTSPADW